MKILCLADIHDRQPVFDRLNAQNSHEYDYVLIAGDILECSDNSSHHTKSVKKWIKIQQHLCCPILLTPGNHDPAGSEYYKRIWKPAREYDIHCLIDESYQLKDGTNVYFTPWSNTFGGWNWMRDEKDMKYDIPEETNIVVSHGPAYGILDTNPNGIYCGSLCFRKALEALPNLKAVVTGHIHGYSHQPNGIIINFQGDERPGPGVHFINASVLDEDYQLKRYRFAQLEL